MVITFSLNSLLTPIYDKNWVVFLKYEVNTTFLNSDDTYIVIFNCRQKQEYDCLMSFPGIKIVYQGPPAVNKNPGHGTNPRNFIVVFEYEPVQTLPEVSG